MLKKQEKTTESYEPVGVKRLYFYYTRVGSEDLDTPTLLSYTGPNVYRFSTNNKGTVRAYSYEKKKLRKNFSTYLSLI